MAIATLKHAFITFGQLYRRGFHFFVLCFGEKVYFCRLKFFFTQKIVDYEKEKNNEWF